MLSIVDLVAGSSALAWDSRRRAFSSHDCLDGFLCLNAGRRTGVPMIPPSILGRHSLPGLPMVKKAPSLSGSSPRSELVARSLLAFKAALALYALGNLLASALVRP